MTNSKLALVTGASSGIGAATAKELAKAGYEVILGARRRDRLEQVAAEITADGGAARVVTLDVTKQEDVDALAAEIDRIDVVSITLVVRGAWSLWSRRWMRSGAGCTRRMCWVRCG